MGTYTGCWAHLLSGHIWSVITCCCWDHLLLMSGHICCCLGTSGQGPPAELAHLLLLLLGTREWAHPLLGLGKP